MWMHSDTWAITTAMWIPRELLSAINERSRSILMILMLGKHYVIYWTKKEKRAWRLPCARRPRQSHRVLFGLSADLVSCWSIKRSGLMLCRAFNMPSEAIVPVLISGKLLVLPTSDLACIQLQSSHMAEQWNWKAQGSLQWLRAAISSSCLVHIERE
uniref:Uncharacterized protein n=1 Tax=Opuntia streptacantha TaxID=393608 RepID=A0A7C9A870_OPUST